MIRSASWIPCLRVRDARASAAWHARARGFKTDWEHQFDPGFPWFISISRDHLTLYLREHRETGTDDAATNLYVEDVNAIHADLVTKGVPIAQAPENRPWGVREMCPRDPDNHRFNVGTDLPK